MRCGKKDDGTNRFDYGLILGVMLTLDIRLWIVSISSRWIGS